MRGNMLLTIIKFQSKYNLNTLNNYISSKEISSLYLKYNVILHPTRWISNNKIILLL